MNWKKEAATAGNQELYPEQAYVATVKSWERAMAKTGTTQIRFKFEFVKPHDFQGKPFTDHFALTERALWRLASFIGCIVKLDDSGEMEVGSVAFQRYLNAAIGKTVGMFLTQESYEGKQKNRVTEFMKTEADLVEVESEEDVPEWVKNHK